MSKASRMFPVPDPNLDHTLNRLQVEIGIVAFKRAMESGKREKDTLDVEVQKLIKECAKWLEDSATVAMKDAERDVEEFIRDWKIKE